MHEPQIFPGRPTTRTIRASRFDSTLAALAGSLLLPLPVVAQSNIATDDTLPGVTARALAGPDYTIGDDEGLRIGDTRFHSFDRFGLATGESATFTTETSGVARYVSRVTGRQASIIDGTIRSDEPSAAFYLVNPNGVVFNENARIEIAGEVVVSTADTLELGDAEGLYHASDPGRSILSSAPVSAFGFLSDRPAPIQIEGSGLSSRIVDIDAVVGAPISLIGGDLEIRGSGEPDELTFVYSRGGRINLASVASPGTVRVVERGPGVGAPDLELDLTGSRGDIFIGDGAVVASGGPDPDQRSLSSRFIPTPPNGSGDIVVRGADLVLEDGEIRALTVTHRDAGRIDIELTGDLLVRSVDQVQTTGISTISGFEQDFPAERVRNASVRKFYPEGPLDIRFGLGEPDGTGTAPISDLLYRATGNGGPISIVAENVRLSSAAEIISSAITGADAGSIEIVARDTIALDAAGQTGQFGSVISSSRGGGDGGAISIRAQELVLRDQGRILSEIREGGDRGGDITIEVDRLLASGDSRIDSSTRTAGRGGDLQIDASESISLSGATNRVSFTGISTISEPEGSGDAGSILVATPTLRISNGARITTTSLGEGDAGVIDLRSGTIRLTGAEITAESQAGLGGDIYVNGGPIEIEPDGGLRFDAPPGVDAGTLLLLQDSVLSTSVNGGGGQGGDVAIATRNLVLSESRLLARAIDGAGGNMRIEANAVVVDDPRDIDASSRRSEDGTIEITSPTVSIRGEATDLPAEVVDATTLLRERCAARSGQATISLVVRERAGLRTPPDGLQTARMSSGMTGALDADGREVSSPELVLRLHCRG